MMIAWIISRLLAAACVLFVISLPLTPWQIGRTLRRVAAAVFLLALVPSVFLSIARMIVAELEHDVSLPSGLVLIFLLLLMSAIAAGALHVRQRLQARDPRILEKRILDPAGPPDFLRLLREQLDAGGEDSR